MINNMTHIAQLNPTLASSKPMSFKNFELHEKNTEKKKKRKERSNKPWSKYNLQNKEFFFSNQKDRIALVPI